MKRHTNLRVTVNESPFIAITDIPLTIIHATYQCLTNYNTLTRPSLPGCRGRGVSVWQPGSDGNVYGRAAGAVGWFRCDTCGEN